MTKSLSKLMYAVKSLFTGIRYEHSLIQNPFNECGLPLLVETRYFDLGKKISFGSGFTKATQKDLKKYNFNN